MLFFSNDVLIVFEKLARLLFGTIIALITALKVDILSRLLARLVALLGLTKGPLVEKRSHHTLRVVLGG